MDRRNRPTALTDAPEHRAIATAEFELRAVGDTLKLTGYASVFDHGYEMYGGPPWGWTEFVEKGAFDETLKQKPDLHLLINHEGMPLARTKSGTLRLATDTHGLHVDADLDRRDPDVAGLEVKMSRKDMDEMSFAFRVKKQAWNDDETERYLQEISLHKGDVSVVNFGANDATSAELKSITDALAALADMEPAALAEVRGLNDGVLLRAQRALAELSGTTVRLGIERDGVVETVTMKAADLIGGVAEPVGTLRSGLIRVDPVTDADLIKSRKDADEAAKSARRKLETQQQPSDTKPDGARHSLHDALKVLGLASDQKLTLAEAEALGVE